MKWGVTTIRSIKSIEAKLKEGRGRGEGKNYTPWLKVREVPSRGLSFMILGWKTRRVHHLLSLNERRYFYLAEWEDDVIDIREQFPLLPIEKTQSIAADLGIDHPIIPRTKKPNVMTTDFVLTLKGNMGVYNLARTIKPSDSLNDKRTLEKLKIEEFYWRDRQTPWCIVTEKEISFVKSSNIGWLHPRRNPNSLSVPKAKISVIQNVLEERIAANPYYPLTDITQDIDSYFKLHRGTCLAVVRHLLANKIWQVDMEVKINPDRPLNPLVGSKMANTEVS